MGKIMLNGVDYSSPTAAGSVADAYDQANAAYNQANAAVNATVEINWRLNSGDLYIGANAEGNAFSTVIGNNAYADWFGVAVGMNVSAKQYYSTALGYNAWANASRSVALGTNAWANAADSVALGSVTSAIFNDTVALGHYAKAAADCALALGYTANAVGSHSVAIGSTTHTVGSFSVALGPNSIAAGNRSTAIGFAAQTSNSNSIQLGDPNGLSSITSKVTIITNSDERDKTDVEDVDAKSIEFLNKVRVIRYVFNGRGMYIDNEENLSESDKEKKRKYGLCAYDKAAHAAGTKKGERKRIGVLAQGVQKALEDTFGSASYANLVNDNLFDFDQSEIPEDVESQLAVNYEGFIPFLIKAVQELDEKIITLANGGNLS